MRAVVPEVMLPLVRARNYCAGVSARDDLLIDRRRMIEQQWDLHQYEREKFESLDRPRRRRRGPSWKAVP